MSLPFITPHNLSEASKLQRALAQKVSLEGSPDTRTLAALDASYKRNESLVAAAVLWRLADNAVLEVGAAAVAPDDVFPYTRVFVFP